MPDRPTAPPGSPSSLPPQGGASSPLNLRNLPANVYLLHDGWAPSVSLSDAAKDEVAWGAWRDGAPAPELVDQVRDHPSLGDVLTAERHVLRRQPEWLPLLGATTGVPIAGGGGQALGAIFFCPVPDHDGVIQWLAWTFGTGFRWLRRQATEPRFGLMVALNSIARGATDPRDVGLSEVGFHQPSPYPQRTASRAAQSTPVGGFRVDPRADLLATVAGPDGDILGNVRGGRAVQWRLDVDSPDDLPLQSIDLFDLYGRQDYKAGIPWVDNIVPVSDAILIAQLRLALAAEIRAHPGSPNVDVLLPDDLAPLGDERSVSFIALPREHARTTSRRTLTMPMVARLVTELPDDEGLSVNMRFLDQAHEELGSATVLDCLAAEFLVGGDHYVTHDGDFYVVVPNFIEAIDTEIARIPASALALPPYRGGDEKDYNREVGKLLPKDVVVVDRQLIRLAHEAGIEAADLIHKAGALIHVKRKGKSAVFSHLCFQAANSARVLRQSEDARAQVVEMARATPAEPALLGSVTSMIDRLGDHGRGCEVTFAMLGDWRGRSALNLPIFSRISLIQAAQDIAALGLRPTVALVGM